MNRFESQAELEPLYTPLANKRRERASHELAAGVHSLEAMKIAGYSKPSAPNARRLANSIDVRRRVLALWEKSSELACLARARRMIEESRLAYSDVVNYFVPDPETGKPRFGNLLEMPREFTAAISKLKFDEAGNISEFTLHDKPAQLRDWRKHLDPAAPRKVEVTGKNGGPISTLDLSKLSDEQLAALEPVLAALAGSGASLGARETREGAASG